MSHKVSESLWMSFMNLTVMHSKPVFSLVWLSSTSVPLEFSKVGKFAAFQLWTPAYLILGKLSRQILSGVRTVMIFLLTWFRCKVHKTRNQEKWYRQVNCISYYIKFAKREWMTTLGTYVEENIYSKLININQITYLRFVFLSNMVIGSDWPNNSNRDCKSGLLGQGYWVKTH